MIVIRFDNLRHWVSRMPVDPTGQSLVNIGDLAKPAVVLIEKISDAIGGIAKPWQIQRVARSEASAEVIKANARIEISDLEERALRRMVKEEGMQQENMENIAQKSLPHVTDSAPAESIDDDWISHFFSKGRLISDEEMQQVWGLMLAGEANNPGSFSKRTVDLVASLDKSDAQLFTKLCGLCWDIGGITPLIFDVNKPAQYELEINFAKLQHLESIGLIHLQSIGGFAKTFSPSPTKERLPLMFHYFGKLVTIHLPEGQFNIETGGVSLTTAGAQLAKICGPEPISNFYDEVIQAWSEKNYMPSELYIRERPQPIWYK